MTNEKAIDLLDDLVGMVGINDTDEVDEALKMAIKALEMQIPTKPNEVDYACMTFECPSCGEMIIAMEDGFNSHKYCLSCGQAIDWSE